MLRNEETQSSLIQYGTQFTHNIGKYLLFGSVATNCLILVSSIAPSTIPQNATCEIARKDVPEGDVLGILGAVFIKDLGLYVFNTAGMMRGIVIPAGHAAFNQLSKCLRNQKPLFEEKTLDLLNMIENSVLVSLTFAMKAEQIPVPQFLKYLFVFSAAVPVARLGFQRFFPDYPSIPSWESLKNTFENQNIAKAAAFFEALFAGLNLANVSSLLIYFIIDNLYDAGHDIDFLYTKETMLAFAAASFLLGALSTSRDWSHNLTTKASMSLAIFYPIAMAFISTLMCLDLQLENPNTFYNKAIYAVLVISGFSAAISILYTRFEATNLDVTVPMQFDDTSIQSVPNIQDVPHEQDRLMIEGSGLFLPKKETGDPLQEVIPYLHDLPLDSSKITFG